MIINIYGKVFWWIPENSEKKSPGSLKYSLDETPILEINELNEDISKTFNAKDYQYKILHGVDYTGKPITLFDVFITNRKSGLTGISITRFVVNRIYVGAHYANEEEILFDKINFSISNLWEWAATKWNSKRDGFR